MGKIISSRMPSNKKIQNKIEFLLETSAMENTPPLAYLPHNI